MAIKPTMTCGAECWAVRKENENRLHVAEMRTLRWIWGRGLIQERTMSETRSYKRMPKYAKCQNY